MKLTIKKIQVGKYLLLILILIPITNCVNKIKFFPDKLNVADFMSVFKKKIKITNQIIDQLVYCL